MTKMLIVDDDEYIRKGLRHLIDWDELGIEIIGEADGGYAAFELFKVHQPHIVLTDIRMPQGGGLELISSIRKLDLSTRIIVLSGYNDFDFVRKAMQHQVEDYLLKPVDSGELKEIIKSCCEQLEEEWYKEQLKRESFQLLKNNILNRWVENRIDWEQLLDKLDFLGVDIRKSNQYQVCVTSWRDLTENNLTEAEKLFRSFAIHNSLEEALRLEGKGLAFINNERSIVCIFIGTGVDEKFFAADNQAWFTEKAHFIAKLLKTPWYSTFSSISQRANQLHLCYTEAIQLQHYISMSGPVVCMSKAELTSYQPAKRPLPSITNQEQSIKALISGTPEACRLLLNEDWLWAKDQADSVAAAKYVATEWIVMARQAIKQTKLSVDDSFFENRLLTEIFQINDFHEIKQQLLSVLFELKKKLAENNQDKKHSMIDQVEQFIQQNYDQELTLQLLSSKYYVNNIYLGRLFKEETGYLFSDYLNRIRLNKAKELLKTTNIKASDIANKVGFIDPNYFFRKFKQEVGLSPSEFRNM